MTAPRRMIMLVAVILAAAGCAQPAAPKPRPTPAATGPIYAPPVRPTSVPGDWSAFTWVVKFVDDQGYSLRGSADIQIFTDPPPSGSDARLFPLKVWTEVPFTYTVWYPAGVKVKTDVYSKARPPIGPDDFHVGIRLSCVGLVGGVEAPGVVEDPQTGQLGPESSHCSYTIGG